MSSSNPVTLVACPTCQKKSPWSTENLDRPFCSPRCKLIDLGAWASESYSIPQQTSEEDEIFSEDLNSDPNKTFL
ncbi:DNA gyrase inhibitor YacG [Marinomonas hwangdonensis]|uniref:DNA gyrase inhibitor YacG n=1 Tax=Marinomonas hwangdonensis TaxID=1053647 RepID=A0A3M8Q4W6_9GAMM|nr:DNA gyrase inhibitor YacG [Marinomonas hwangdonensis]MDP5056839.1 DNA gyrase inhibitor YacG [Marinomonas hwangdonensis]RNF51145.1 DNA gyrase inhibitor YacG [Marinomonas hwangdonensis]